MAREGSAYHRRNYHCYRCDRTAVVYAFIYVAFHGGIKGTYLSLKPRPNLERADIKEKRTKVRAEIETVFANIMDKSDFIAVDTAVHDVCYKGTRTSPSVTTSHTAALFA